MTKTLRTGYNCRTCNARHEYPSYVFAHFDECLTHTCACGAKHDILAGVAEQITPGKVPAKDAAA